MENLLTLIPALPLLSFIVLIFAGRHLGHRGVALIGAGSICISAILAIILGLSFLTDLSTPVVAQTLWTWLDVAGLKVNFAFHLDALSLVFVFVITFVGALIHIYSIAFMAGDKDYSRFFACMNLFVFSMLVLVLADNLVLLYLGWEGVGLCSYLLIGFWYENPVNGYAARKAFVMTRIGDTAMAIGLFMIFHQLGTLVISDVLEQSPIVWGEGSSGVTMVALLLLGGAVGKSAQLPLQTWLPDAMAGPSPVSALIHAATMVTAGVYLISRMYMLFQLSPVAQLVVAIIGAATLLVAGISALTQYDIKRVLAYSTISQIGYMFLALGVGAWTAAIFHFMVHAFFKALLFLGAGAVIEALHHEHSMLHMGGLRKQLPVVFWTFIAGSVSLAAVPLISAGFYSKDQILWYSWSAALGSPALWFVALLGAFITAVYTTRMILLTFFGTLKTRPDRSPGLFITIPLIVLAFLSITAGFVELPHNFGHYTFLSDQLHQVLPETVLKLSLPAEWIFQLIAAVITLTGIYIAYLFYYRKPDRAESSSLHRFLVSGWGFDHLYNRFFVNPLVWVATINKNDIVDKAYQGVSRITVAFYKLLSLSQSGSLRWYIMSLVVGAIIILGIEIIL